MGTTVFYMDTDTYPERVARTVGEAMKAGGWSEKALAEATRIPRVTLRRRLAGSAFTIAELYAIAQTLETTVTDLVGEDAA